MKLIKGLRSLNRVAAVIVFVLGAGGARAVELGDSAPPIQISEWVKGGPISLAKGSNFYVLDFWATEGSNSRYTVPYVSNLQRTYRSKGVIMIGVTSEPASRIKKFLSGLESPVEYAQAVDLNGRTTASYLGTPGGLDLPHAFVIDREGRVVWHGNSTVALEQVLKQALEGTLTVEAAQRTIAAEKAIREYFTLATLGTDPLRMADLGDQVIQNGSAYASILNEFAWRILTDRRIKTANRDFQLALRASQAAYELSGGKEVPIMDTHARALFQAGRRSEAMAIEKKAIAACEDPRYRPELESVLMRFERLSRPPTR